MTHTVTCCKETASATVCADHLAGAYIGGVGATTRFSDIIPTTNQTVWEFIQAHQAHGDLLPLIIEGELIAGTFPLFTMAPGIWAEEQK